jgi:hypothetical protein
MGDADVRVVLANDVLGSEGLPSPNWGTLDSSSQATDDVRNITIYRGEDLDRSIRDV